MQHTTRIATALLLSGITLFTACKKEESNTDQLASLGKTTITGKAYATLVDTSGNDGIQYAPAGTTVQAWIDTRDLVVYSAATTYAKRYFTATVDASGSYTLSIDASKYQPVTVHISAPTFAHDVMKKYPNDSLYNERHIFQMTTTPIVSGTQGTTNVVDVNFL